MDQGRRVVSFTLTSFSAITFGLIAHQLSQAEPARAAGSLVLATRAVGAPANDYPRGEACLSRIAIHVTFGAVCSDLCVTDAQCPSGWGCKTITQGNGQDVGLCFPRRVTSP